MRRLKKASDFLASYRLSCALFLLLLLLTYLGTMYQVENGLYLSQQKYFESVLVIHWAFGVVPLPLPGAYLVMLAAFANLFWGVVVRFRLEWSKVGMVVAHAGILILLVGAFVSYMFSVSGHMTLNEQESSNEIQASHDWEISVREAAAPGPVTEHIIPQDDFEDLKGEKSRVFTFPGQPFRIKISGFAPNVMPTGDGAENPHAGGTQRLFELPPEKDYESNLAGAAIETVDVVSGEARQGVVWAGDKSPARFSAGGRAWDLSLRKRRWLLPFTIRLDRFVRELHPGTSMAREFSSYVTKTEDGMEQQTRITMNEPLRHHGFTFYQSSWGPQNAGDGDRLYSVFSVVRNPADQVPLYACVITTLGLVWHFLQKLAAYLRREKADRARTS